MSFSAAIVLAGSVVTSVWPAPLSATNGSGVLTVAPSPSFFSCSGCQSDLLSAAFARYHGIAFPHMADASSRAGLAQLSIAVDDLDESHPQLETDESYTLSVPSSGNATATAKTVVGAAGLRPTPHATPQPCTTALVR